MTNDLVVIHTKFTLHQRVYLRTAEIERAAFPVGSIEWIWPQLVQDANVSQKSPKHSQDIEHLIRGLKLATSLPSWRDVANTPAKDVVAEQALRFFSEFEGHLLEKIGDNHTSARLSATVRTLVSNRLAAEASDERMQRLRRLYRARCVTVSRGRELISDLIDGNRPPISAQPHKNLTELQETTRTILLQDLNRIRGAAMSVLKRYEAAVQQLDQWEGRSLEAAHESRIRTKVEELGVTAGDNEPWGADDIEALMSLQFAITNGRRPPFKRATKGSRTTAPNVLRYVKRRLQEITSATGLDHVLDLREAPSGEVLLACALIIQIKTGWNFISVLEMQPMFAKIKGFPHQLQSIKPRTKDETPLVFVESSDEDVVLALRILSSRYDRLVRKGFEKPSLWESSRSVRYKSGGAVVGWGPTLRAFCKKYELPAFSLEMIRVQVLAVAAATSGDLSVARSLAGHLATGTTFSYVNKLLMRRLNAANSLEFERRFDATVRYMIDSTSVDEKEDLIPFPIGDGASCKDPRKPPHAQSLASEMCSGELCHRGEGCPNRVLDITLERMEEVVRTKVYYERNWNRLANENEVAFEQLHLPKIEFVLGLYGAIRRGPYRHLLKRYEEA